MNKTTVRRKVSILNETKLAYLLKFKSSGKQARIAKSQVKIEDKEPNEMTGYVQRVALMASHLAKKYDQ